MVFFELNDHGTENDYFKIKILEYITVMLVERESRNQSMLLMEQFLSQIR